MTSRYYAKQLGPMFGRKWGIIDASDDSLFRHWRGPKRRKGRIWTGTELEAEELVALMNNGSLTELGKVSIVSESFDPPDRENARMKAIARNAESKRKSVSISRPQGFKRCESCGKMVKADHVCSSSSSSSS